MFIRKRGNKWQSQIRITNRPCLSKSFKSKTDAKRWSVATENKIRREDGGIAKIKYPLFRDVATRYINEVSVLINADSARFFKRIKRNI